MYSGKWKFYIWWIRQRKIILINHVVRVWFIFNVWNLIQWSEVWKSGEMKKLANAFSPSTNGMLKVQHDNDTHHSRTSLASIFEDLASIRKSILGSSSHENSVRLFSPIEVHDVEVLCFVILFSSWLSFSLKKRDFTKTALNNCLMYIYKKANKHLFTDYFLWSVYHILH